MSASWTRMSDYGTASYSGRVVRECDNSSSIVVDWRGKERAVTDTSALEAEEVLYKRTVMADGFEKGAGKSLSMRVLRRKDLAKPSPVVLYFPGGGFVSCSYDILSLAQEYLALAGYVVISAEYRLVGEALVDGMLEDISDAVAYVRENAWRYEADPGRMALMGNSASGYLVSLAGTKLDLGAQAVISLYGPTDLLRIADDHEESTQEAWHDSHSVLNQIVNGVFSTASLYDDVEKAEAVNPLRYVDGTEPPFLFMHGEMDPEVSPSQTAALHDALLRKGARSTRYSLRGAFHGGPCFDSEEALASVLSFLSRAV